MNILLPKYAADALKFLSKNGYEAYVVGGCVRDSLLGRVPYDWDITTNATPNEIMRCFDGCRVIETGIEHGTVTVLLDGVPIEITTYRVDGDYSDHRRPDSVTFTSELKSDLSRRDFTINAMAYSPEIGLVDYFGGVEDLEAKRICCVGNPATRFTEDALRILRAIRFSATLGFSVEPETKKAAHMLAPNLEKISHERISSELSKALTAEYIEATLREHTEIFLQILPELRPLVGFNQHNIHHHLDVWQHTVETVAATKPELILRLAMLFHDCAKPKTFTLDNDGVGHFYGHSKASSELAYAALTRLKYDNATRNSVVDLIKHHGDMIKAEQPKIKRLLNRMGEQKLRQLIEVKRADCAAQAPQFRCERKENLAEIEKILDEIILQKQAFCLKDLAVSGDDLIEIGFTKDKKLGEALQELLRQVIDDETNNKRIDIMNSAKRILRKNTNE